jgi:acetyl esterase/lipase
MNVAMHNKNDYEIIVADHQCPRPDGSILLIRVAQPQGDGPFPAVVDVHGGGWHMGDRNQNAVIDDTLARNGIVAVAPEFRQAPDHKYPVGISDIHLAVRWLKANAAKFRIKPEWVGGIGTSSGGHQLMTMMMKPNDPRYAALALSGAAHDASLAYVIAAWPVADPLARFRMAQGRNDAGLLGAHAKYWASEEEMAEGNPQQILARGEFGNLPPLLVLQGTNDDNLPPDMASNFVTAYRKAGGVATLNVFENQKHTFVTREPDSAASRQALGNMVDFIHAQTK